jgi:hypothetical protein
MQAQNYANRCHPHHKSHLIKKTNCVHNLFIAPGGFFHLDLINFPGYDFDPTANLDITQLKYNIKDTILESIDSNVLFEVTQINKTRKSLESILNSLCKPSAVVCH